MDSGLIVPMWVFLTFTLLRFFVPGTSFTVGGAVLDFCQEMLGGAAIGIAAGAALTLALRRLPLERPLANVLALTGGLAVFGGAQLAHASGFLATYLAGVMVSGIGAAKEESLDTFLDGMGWLAQIALFLMLGLLVTPHVLPPFILPAIIGAAVLIDVPAEEVRKAREGLGKTWSAGKITAIAGTRIRVQRLDGVEQSIAVDENTSFQQKHDSVTLADLRAGQGFRAEGHVANGTFTATTLTVFDLKGHEPWLDAGTESR